MLRQSKLIIRKTIVSASVDPQATWEWLMNAEKDNLTFDDLYLPGDTFASPGCKLRVAVNNLMKGQTNLRNDIMVKTETLAKEGKMVASRQVLMMVYAYSKTDVENGSAYDIEDIIVVTLRHNQMEHSLQRWM